MILISCVGYSTFNGIDLFVNENYVNAGKQTIENQIQPAIHCLVIDNYRSLIKRDKHRFEIIYASMTWVHCDIGQINTKRLIHFQINQQNKQTNSN